MSPRTRVFCPRERAGTETKAQTDQLPGLPGQEKHPSLPCSLNSFLEGSPQEHFPLQWEPTRDGLLTFDSHHFPPLICPFR